MQLIMNSFFDEDPESIVTNWAENVRMQMEYPEYYQMTLDNPKSFLDILETCDSGEMVKKRFIIFFVRKNMQMIRSFWKK